ncbi:MAG: sensor histidine kinase [Bryobacteraceae bacterium]
MRTRTWPILVLGFGSLVFLIALAGAGASRRARQIQAEIVSIHESETQVADILNGISSQLQVSGILVRDFLLDPSHLTAVAHRQRLLELRTSTGQQLDELGKRLGPEDTGVLSQLRYEIDAYWDSFDPIFEWTPQQKLALSALFLRKQVLPRRDAALMMAREIQKLNQSHVQRQRQRLRQSQVAFHRYVLWMIGIVVSLGVIVAAVSIFRVTELEKQTEAQQKITEQAERELRQLSQQLVQAQETERKWISRELHDEVGQMLMGLRMELAKLNDVRSVPDEEFHARLEDVKRIVEQTVVSVRNIAMGLRPSMLDDLGLGPAVEWLGREFSRRSGTPVTVQVDGALDEIPETHRTCVFRVVQEALTNCGRHAKANNIRIAVHGRRDAVFVTVQDDGVGLTRDTAGQGLGLIGIQERVRELNGTLTILSQPNRGTSLQAEIPLGSEAVS